MKKLIISCDDLGISKEINSGIKDCLDSGVATSSSIIANGKFYSHALEEVVAYTPIKFYGLHLNLTEGYALSDAGNSQICDKNNKFKISAKKYFLLNLSQSNKKLEECVYVEFKSQIQKVLKDGIKISHFDSHEHIHHSPWIFRIITVLGKEFNINKIRFVNEKIIIKNYLKNAYSKIKNLNYFKHLVINICNKKINNPFISPDYFFGILNSNTINLDEFFVYLNQLNYAETVELCIHPGNRSESSKKNENRVMEKNLLLSDKFKNFIDNKKISLINFSDIT